VHFQNLKTLYNLIVFANRQFFFRNFTVSIEVFCKIRKRDHVTFATDACLALQEHDADPPTGERPAGEDQAARRMHLLRFGAPPEN
jgi:hypothetical protein